MSDRNVPFEFDAVCDWCGCYGAFDFMGDYYCPKCLASTQPPEDLDDCN